MARRDVDLVIKARDEAAGVVDSITKALNEFITAQKNLDSRAERTEGTLTNLGAAIGTLDKELRGLSFGDKLTRELNVAQQSLARIEGRFESTAREAGQLDKRLTTATATAERYSQKLERTGQALARQQTTLKKAKTDQTAYTQALIQAETAQGRLEARQQRLPGLIAKAADAADKAGARFNDLSAQVAGTAEPTRKLREQLARSENAMLRTQERLTKLRTEYSQIGGQLRAAGSAVVFFANQQERAAAEIARQERIIEGTKQRYAELKVQASSAGRNQGDLARELDKVSASLATQERSLERARGNYTELVAATGQAEAALKQLGTASVGALNKQLTDQRRAVLESKRAYVEAREEATRLGQAMASAVKPSAELRAEFDQARVRLAAAKQSLLDNRIAYEQLGRTVRGTTTDYESVRAAQDRFASVQGELKSKLTQTATAAQRQQTEIAQLAGVSGRAASGANSLASSADRLANANRRAATSTSQLDAAYRRFYGGTRQSLSILQRIRGEILSLAAAYGGLFAGIQVLQGAINATQALEAATSRLGVAFDGDTGQVGRELDFLRRTAARLGVNFGTLATEYSKFQIATKNTALSVDATRKVFTQITEAARVNRSSTKELAGVFTALTQIVSKGAVQQEELRQQLGDRLPGAIQIMADALGVGTAELVKMIEAGEVTEASLIKFGDEIEKRFGGGLPDALESVTVALGRLQAAAFEALLQFGEAGFIEGFQDLVEDLTDTLRSAEFQDFAARLSRGLGNLAQFIGFAVRNFDLLVSAALAFVGLRLTPVVIAVTKNLTGMIGALNLSSTAFTTLQARAAASGVQITRTGLAVRNLTRAFRVLLSSTGIGLAVTAISFAIGAWATAAEEATEAMVAHRNVVDTVKNAYDEVDGSVEQWQERLQELTTSEIEGNIQRLRDALETVRTEADRTLSGNEDFNTNFFGINLRLLRTNIRDARRAVEPLFDSFRNNELGGDDFIKAIDDALQATDDGSEGFQRYQERVIQAAREEVKMADAIAEGNSILEARNGTLEDATEATYDLDLATRDLNEGGYDPAKAKEYQGAVDSLNKIMADSAEKAEELETALQIDGAFETAIANAQTLDEYVDAFLAKEGALKGVFQTFSDDLIGGADNGIDAAAKLIANFEDFRNEAYPDFTIRNGQRVNSGFRAGFGSDTITLDDGTIKKITQGMYVSQQDATRDLYRRIETEFRPRAEAAAGGRFGSFTPAQQAALTSIAYNYGDIPDRIVAALRSGSNEQIAQAIRALGADNGGINRDRRFTEAATFSSTTGREDSLDAIQQEREDAEEARKKAAEDREEERQQTAETIAANEEALAQQQLINAGKEREAEIQKAISDARKDDPNITEEEIAKIREQTGAMFDLEQAKKNARTESEAAKDAEEEVNRLLELQRVKREQLKAALEEGDTETANALRNDLVGLNEQLDTATQKAIAMWEAVGGTESDLAVAKLQQAYAEAQKLNTEGDKVYFSWKQVGDLFIDGVAGAFDTFAQQVAEGANVFQAARTAFLQFAADFLRQIAMMIIKQAIFNALKGTSFGNFLGIGVAHTGGVVGSQGVRSASTPRRVSAAAFAGAMRFHSGGLPGLRPGEVPIIAQQGEEVLSRDDPRNVLNGAAQMASSGGGGSTTIVNAIDGTDALDKALSSPMGQKVLLNYIRANSGDIKTALG